MKYIRTKDTEFRIGEILKVLHEDENYFECEGTFEKRMGCKAYVKKEIVIKVADTIEELCDEFIVISDNCEKPIISALPFGELQLYAKGRTKYTICYGAIWTEKGLQFVARMNSKGVLELL